MRVADAGNGLQGTQSQRRKWVELVGASVRDGLALGLVTSSAEPCPAKDGMPHYASNANKQ